MKNKLLSFIYRYIYTVVFAIVGIELFAGVFFKEIIFSSIYARLYQYSFWFFFGMIISYLLLERIIIFNNKKNAAENKDSNMIKW